MAVPVCEHVAILRGATLALQDYSLSRAQQSRNVQEQCSTGCDSSSPHQRGLYDKRTWSFGRFGHSAFDWLLIGSNDHF